MNIRSVLLVGVAATLLAPAVEAQAARVGPSAVALNQRPDVLMRPADLVVRGVSLSEALTTLSERTGVPIAFSASLLPSGDFRVSCDCAEVTMAEALDRLLTGTALARRQVHEQVVIFPRGEAIGEALRATDFEVRPAASLVQPAATIRSVTPRATPAVGGVRGAVVEAGSGRPLSGVQVVIVNLGRRAITNAAGEFVIDGIPDGAHTIRVQTIGHATVTQAVTVIPGTMVEVVIELPIVAFQLDELVVTGTPGAATRRSLGNAVTTIDAAEVTRKVVNTNVSELLQAKATGVTVMPGGGTPGTGSSIRIRGASSLVAQTAPVVYVDGVRMYSGSQGSFWNSWRSQRPGENSYGAGQEAMALDMLNPEDIESIEVIKGPAAATLYGAEAANGVIQIITKKGKPGNQDLAWDARIQAGRTNWAVDRVTNFTTCTPAAVADTLIDGTRRFPGCQGAAGSILEATSLDAPGTLRTGEMINYALSVRGGGEGYSFFAAADRDEEQGVFENSTNNRTALRANFAFYPKENLDFTVNVGYNKTYTKFPINDDGYGVIQGSVNWRPGHFINPDDPNASCPTEGFAGPGPECVYEWWNNELRADRITMGTTVNYRPFPWLSNRLTVGLDQTERLADKYLPPGSIYGGTDGSAERGAPQNAVYTVDLASTAHVDLSEQFTSDLSVGFQYFVGQYRNTIARGSGFASGTIRQVALAAATESFTEFTDQKSLGLYVQEQVGWNDRLYLTGAVRIDNNSAFGEDINLLAYPKVSASYVVSEESFIDGLDWVDELKVRAAWGQAGNAPAPFAGQRSFTSGPTVDETGTRVPALRTNQFGNPDIVPERGQEIEVGLDASLFNRRLGLELTYYDQRTKDALMAVPVAPSSGFLGSRFENLGEIHNSGFEMSLSVTPILNPTLTWDSRLGFSTNSNELVSFGYERDPITLTLYQPVQRHQPGFPLGGYWGTFPLRDGSGNLVADATTGALLPDSQVYIGPSVPTREMSLSNTFTLFGNLQVYALLDYKGGHYLYNVKDQYRCWGGSLPSAWNPDPAANIPGACWEVNDPDQTEEFRRIRQQDPSVNNGVFIQKADFIKFRDLSLTYTLPQSWARRLGTDRAAFTLAVHNLGFLWKPDYTGPDPEVNFTGVNDPGGQFAFIRVDSWTAPMTRRFAASLEVSF